jgi:hypothetical protein
MSLPFTADEFLAVYVLAGVLLVQARASRNANGLRIGS